MSDEPRQPSRIPDFASRDEESTWWDSHDLADYWDEFAPVNVKISPRLLSETAMSVRLPDTTIDRLRQRAALIGVGHTTVARIWLMERLA
ncbi:MAG: BrnA antitoxin family protein [Chloroflexota bacterium]|nr:BrnA antitoxin family protein [Chloroflexota bacterium]